jgi:para-nitrobenzyl esterase
MAMWLPALRIAEAHARHAPTWMYRFDWPAAAEGLGAPHGVDIPFPFTNIDVGGWDAFVSDPEQAMALASTVSRTWASFARNGKPEITGLDWPTYDSDKRATVILDRDVRVELDPDGPVRQAWTGRTQQGES